MLYYSDNEQYSYSWTKLLTGHFKKTSRHKTTSVSGTSFLHCCSLQVLHTKHLFLPLSQIRTIIPVGNTVLADQVNCSYCLVRIGKNVIISWHFKSRNSKYRNQLGHRFLCIQDDTILKSVNYLFKIKYWRTSSLYTFSLCASI